MTTDEDGGEDGETVYVTARRGGGDRNHVHTDPECERLTRANSVFEKDAAAYEGEPRCRLCAGEAIRVGTPEPNRTRRELEALDPADVGLTPLGERPGQPTGGSP